MKTTMFHKPQVIFMAILILVTTACEEKPKYDPAPILARKISPRTSPLQIHYPTLDLDQIKPLFPYHHLLQYRISDTLSVKAKVDGPLFRKLFQDFTNRPPYPKNLFDHPRTDYIQHGEEYLISYLEDIRWPSNEAMLFDLVAVYSKKQDTSRIYMLFYPSESIDSDFKIPKGEQIAFWLQPTLAEKIKLNPHSYEVYSEFLEGGLFKRTTIHRYPDLGITDSLIETIQLTFSDEYVIMEHEDYLCFQNGTLIDRGPIKRCNKVEHFWPKKYFSPIPYWPPKGNLNRR